MSESEKIELEPLVRLAQELTQEKRQQFLLQLPPETRVAIVRALDRLEGERNGTLVDHVADDEIRSAATIVVSPSGSDSPTDSNASKDLTATDEGGKKENPARVSPKTVIVDGRAESSLTIVNDGVDSSSPSDGAGASEDRGSGVYLVKLHARGAIGEVFVAYDEKLSREVAIKRIRPELPPNLRRVKRFRREAEITAKLQHPGIVPIYTMGDAGGSPHYTMPLVSGVTMAELVCDTHEKLSPSASRQEWISAMRPLLRHFIAVCNAIDYAHTENVVHRDLKPSNIMIGSRGQTMVLDWGCAKNINNPESPEEDPEKPADEESDEDDLSDIFFSDFGGPRSGADITISGSVMGTIEYMSPEQAMGKNEDVGKPSDIFGLGATLFSVLTNQRSVDHDSKEDLQTSLGKVKRGEFRRAEEMDSRVPSAINAICGRAMAFLPEERYATAGELGRDVEAFLAGDQVSAYQEQWYEQMRRFVRRHQTLFTSLAGVLLVGFLSLAASNVVINRQKGELAKSFHTERELRARANRGEDLAKKQLYGSQMLLASEASTEAGGLGRMRELIGKWTDKEFDFLRGWEWEHLNSLGSRELWTHESNLTVNQIISTRDEKLVKVFDRGLSAILTLDLEQLKTMGRETVDSDCSIVDFNRDQSKIAMGHDDGRVAVRTLVEGGPAVTILHREHSARVFDVKWNIGSDLVASCDTDGKVVIWHVGDQKIIARAEGVLTSASKSVLAWSYDGHQLFWSTGRTIERLNMSTKKQETSVTDYWITDPCNSHEGKLLAYVGPENTIVVANIKGEILHRFEGHQLFVESLQWHPHKNLLLSSSGDGTVRIWNPDTKKEIRQLLGHEGHVYSATWNSEGTLVTSGGLPEDALRVWDVSDVGKEAFDRELQDHPAFAWHPSGDELVVAEGIDLVVQNRAGDSRWIRQDDQDAEVIFAVDYHPLDDVIACVAGNGKIWTLDAETGEQQKVFDPGADQDLFPAITSRGVQWSPDGKFLAGIGGKGALQVWNVADGKLVSEKVGGDRMLSIAWAPAAEGGQRIAAVGTDRDIVVFDPQTEKIVKRIVQDGWKTGLAWSPNGKVLAVSNRRSVNLWNVDDGLHLKSCEGPSSMVCDVAWSDSQDRFAALTEDGKVCVWASETGEYLAKFALHPRTPYCLRWSPDGKRLASTARFGRIVFQEID